MAPNKAVRTKVEQSAPAPAKNDLSLDDMLRISRQKDVNERLAQSIFGKDRRSSAPGVLGRRGKAASMDALPTLASRVGVSKRGAKSSTNLRRDAMSKTRALASHPSPLQRHHSADPGSIAARIGRARPAAAAAAAAAAVAAAAPPPAAPTAPAASYSNTTTNNSNISIRGIAGPVAVIATNFAPGTTAADIRSAFESVSGEMLSCRLKSSSPVVTAEMILADRAGADAVIETFDNQKADGRLLRVYLQHGYSGTGTGSAAASGNSNSRDGQSWSYRDSAARESDNNVMPSGGSSNSHSGSRRVAEPDYRDGRYGFDDHDAQDEGMDVELDQPAPVPQETNGGGASGGSGGGSGPSRRDDRSNDYQHHQHHHNGSYRDSRDNRDNRDRRGGDSGRYERGGGGGGRQGRGLYSDRYGRGSYNVGGGGGGGGYNGSGSGAGRGWRSSTLYL